MSLDKQEPLQGSEQTATQPYDIFISYRTTHRDWVEILAKNLKAQGYHIFLDSWELIPGQQFPQGIENALQNARNAILVASPDATESGWVQWEYNSMLQRQKSQPDFRLIPVVMGEFPDMPFLEKVHAVDFSDSNESAYRQAFQRLLAGIDGQPPGADPRFDGKLQLPEPTTSSGEETRLQDHGIIDRVFDHVGNGLPVMLLAQEQINTGAYAEALCVRAAKNYRPENVLRIYPPSSTKADAAAYFGRLAKQAKLEDGIDSCWEWGDALRQRLENQGVTFLLITGFENGADELRQELAGELRQLKENHFFDFHLVMLGGQRLAAQKYQSGVLSLLNIAEEMQIPEPTLADWRDILRQPDLTGDTLNAIQQVTGGHPRLTQYVLSKGVTRKADCEAQLHDSPLPTQLFNKFLQESEQGMLCRLLREEGALGNFHVWTGNELLRRLYWHNLLRREGSTFVWRSEFIRRAGLELLSC
ncbi:MAG: hypothetical protein OI74_07510 [Gammaproteobacteria bacterium (ex Lamellibrachia satsuma)]|nr:MAG: toll/interleukin-1 receptor domain-containing protein [Gammaproteobacteria bacterium (ex Lamellibrachia satsuma)]RRS33467.1 MAG: hypothetical protein OI74_07510 [Gammaproteobacteria bacterium (ex Lamellibrachia satsuma)]RRS37646.1 MAG: hypothetical protein NV67_00040 [Gammaproteobacteria bacterium (ex Lamellibrachia satsuma)]